MATAQRQERGESHLPAEGPRSALRVEVAATPFALAGYYRVRSEVFVREQEIYRESDRDIHDESAIPIVAVMDGQVVGAVRCYRKSGSLWYGGRLAVLPQYRVYNIGAMLVHKAVEVMTAHPEVGRFLATVQIQNVRFFRRLGWLPIGRPILLQGIRHQVMEKLLDRNTLPACGAQQQIIQQKKVENHEHLGAENSSY